MKNQFSRRKFLKTAVISSTAIVVPGSINASYKRKDSFTLNPNPLKLGILTYTIAMDWDIETYIKNLTAAGGYQSVELRTTKSAPGSPPNKNRTAHGVEVELTPEERAEVKKRFKDSPLEAISLAGAFQYHSPDPAILKQNIEGTKEYILLARDVGAIGIRVFPNQLPDDVPEEQANREKIMEQIGKALGEVGEFGFNHGVEVRVCVHGRNTDNIPVIKKIIDYSGSPHVYVNWNCSNKDVEGKGFEYNFNLIKDRIKALHIHELWDEKYPYRLLFKLLADNGFKGYCNAEISGNEDPIRLLKFYRALFLSLQNAY